MHLLSMDWGFRRILALMLFTFVFTIQSPQAFTLQCPTDFGAVPLGERGMLPCWRKAVRVRRWADPTIFLPRATRSMGAGRAKQKNGSGPSGSAAPPRISDGTPTASSASRTAPWSQS